MFLTFQSYFSLVYTYLRCYLMQHLQEHADKGNLNLCGTCPVKRTNKILQHLLCRYCVHLLFRTLQ